MFEDKIKKTLFDAYKKGFYDGMSSVIAVFNIPKESVKEKLDSIGLIDGRISELYHMWMGFINDNHR